ncbi:aminoacyl-tRNA hydrolase [Caproicibacterium sp. BJN0003]|uniref:aminoacyl-tRNA hydrolase n=1 Tax=Caproicibacterium sp. BJN0003 TaxID=2994078 RepID=UPI0022546525|nr:aminoacyl-tRNA hydrolase [Caproicibacterium sp. BJN0003]UZT82079.1 aminoacyl-tRNA hydrolase [Caproicibacterium sp. BJN0003]
MFFQKSPEAIGSIEYLLVGLGNPGKEYEGTRHNTGFMAIDKIADDAGVKLDRLKFKGLCTSATFGGKKVLLLKPSTFMNLSGQSVTEAMRFYKLPPEKVIVLFDDISLPCGHLRIRRKGSDGGHNGMKNILYLSGSDQFPRIKIGVGKKPNPQWDLADWVLSHFSTDEMKLMDESTKNAAAAAALMVNDKIDEAMNRYNG